MNNDRQINISAGNSRKAMSWPVQKMYWSEFVDRLKTPVKGSETLAQYLKYPKSKQDDLKDVGGFVGGVVNGQRKAGNIAGRDLVTLDLDNIPQGETDSVLRILETLGCSYCTYSTRKHEPVKPRLRVIIPLSTTCSADEYEPVARKLAEMIGMEYADPTTFQASRLMYWPSVSSDSQYVYRYSDKPMADPKGILGLYKNWRDVTSWPRQENEEVNTQKLIRKQGDPEEKTGIVGAFCRTYDVYRAMEELIQGEYLPTEMEGRYTYAEGSTTGGAVIYQGGKFLYSHHATDPCSGRLVNAFDLVRLHKFADLDDDAAAGTPTNRLPSYGEMCTLASSIPEVTTLLNTERYEKAKEAFTDAAETPAECDMTWMSRLSCNDKGNINKTVDNITIIIENDPALKEHIEFNEFQNCVQTHGSLPWNSETDKREWLDYDDSGLRWYLEKVYNITGKDKIFDGLNKAAQDRTVNDVKDYLRSMPDWDGKERLDTLLIDYLGAEDSAYVRAVTRKSIVAAVARIMEPGCKYDYMLIMTGPQGIGKSMLLRALGGKWYSDSIVTFEGKDAAESLQGQWIVEVAELSAMGRSRNEVMKQFISKQDDVFRKAYGRRTNRYPRQCVIFGTTNDSEFLKDSTGNRRFWPVEVTGGGTKNVFKDLPEELPQIWAEAKVRYAAGEELYLSGVVADAALKKQEEHAEDNGRKGMIIGFMCKEVSVSWESTVASARKLWWMSYYSRKKEDSVKRDKICAAEVWVECFGQDIGRMTKGDSREINTILENLTGLIRKKNSQNFGPYGSQRGFQITEDFYQDRELENVENAGDIKATFAENRLN